MLRMRCGICAGGLVAGLLLGAQVEPLDPDVLLLSRIKAVAGENLVRQPNYTCLQTIERSRRRGPKARFELVDTIRLEVALINGNELFSWPGAGKFEDRKISDLVGGGTIGNGNFALHARSVFLSSVPRFFKAGEVAEAGRRLIRYRYTVPRFRSGFRIRFNGLEDIVGYDGSFDVDAVTLDLARLEVNAIEIPPHIPVASSRDVMRYARARIGASDFLLPASSELTMISMDGTESRNRVEFTACHQYSGESVLTFDEPPPVESVPPPPAPVELVELPEGVDVDLRLNGRVRFGTSTVGDEILAMVAQNVKRRGELLIPKGATARGRLLGLEKRSQIHVAIIEFNEIEFPGRRAPLYADLVDVGPYVAGLRVFVGETPKAGGTLLFNRPELPKGFRMIWRTQSPRGK